MPNRFYAHTENDTTPQNEDFQQWLDSTCYGQPCPDKLKWKKDARKASFLSFVRSLLGMLRRS